MDPPEGSSGSLIKFMEVGYMTIVSPKRERVIRRRKNFLRAMFIVLVLGLLFGLAGHGDLGAYRAKRMASQQKGSSR